MRYGLRLLAVLLLELSLPACSRQERVAVKAAGAGPHAANAPSLFELPFPFVDASGRTVRLDELRGTPFVASMVYTHCTSVCPRITSELKSLERALPPELARRTRFVLFSLDPGRDTPAALATFAREHGLDPGRWTLLAAGPDDVRTLAAVLGVRYRPDGDGEFAHSAVIVVVDRNGAIRHRRLGLGADLTELVAAVREAE